jgi:hypothetical protein
MKYEPRDASQRHLEMTSAACDDGDYHTGDALDADAGVEDGDALDASAATSGSLGLTRFQ